MRPTKSLVAIGLAVTTMAAASAMLFAPNAAAVAGGSNAAEGEYPFAAKFIMTNIPRPDGTTYDSACSGALVSSRWVITAGHCFHDVDRNRVGGPPRYHTTVTVGRTDDADTNQGYVREVIDVRQSPVNDIALAELATPITTITPLRLSWAAPEVGEILTLAGWGSLTATDPHPATHLQIATVGVSDITATTVGVHGVSSSDASACPYDSGAPYFVPGDGSGTLVSVESTGPACPHTSPETTARVDPVASWIYGQIVLGQGSEGVGRYESAGR